MRSHEVASTRIIHSESVRPPAARSRSRIESSRRGPGATSHRLLPPAAVAPLVPQYPLSTSVTRLPVSAAEMAAQVAAGPPPSTRTSVSSVSGAVMADLLADAEFGQQRAAEVVETVVTAAAREG